MKKVIGRILLFSLIVFAIVLSAAWFAGCNPVKKVLQDPAKKEIVGREWAKVNPCVNDSIFISVPGDTIVNESVVTDTIYNVLTDTVSGEASPQYYPPYEIVKTKIINKFLHDTIKVVVRDKRAERILQDSVDHYHGKTVFFQSQNAEYRKQMKQAQRKLLLFKIALGALIGVALLYKFRKQIIKLIKPL